MAADVTVKSEPENPCCKAWKLKYSKLEEKRGALRQAVKLLEQQIDKVQTENVNLQKAYEQEQARTEKEKEGKDRELAARVSLEKEVSSLKSEISSLQHTVGSVSGDGIEKVSLLEARVAQGEKEIKHLKEVIKKEKANANSEKKKAETEKKRATEAFKQLQAEKSKAADERKISYVEHQKAEDYKLQLEELRKEADEVRLKYEETNKKLEIEKQRTKKERQRADTEKGKAEELKKLAVASERKSVEEKSRSDNLCREVEQSKQMIEKLQKEIHEIKSSINASKGLVVGVKTTLGIDMENKTDYNSVGVLKTRTANSTAHMTAEGPFQRLEIHKQNLVSEKQGVDSEMRKAQERKLMEKYRKRALKEKSRADKLVEELKMERQRIQELQGKHQEDCSRNLIEASSIPSSKDVNGSSKLKILKKKLKIEKMKAKHAKEVAELEKHRCNFILQEVNRMKLDFGLFSHRLSVLDSYLKLNYGGIDELEKNGNTAMESWKKHLGVLQPLQTYLQMEHQLLKPGSASVATTEVQHLPETERFQSTCRGSSTDFTSGINSKSELLPGGSSRKKLKRSGINSALASFSDRGLVGSQDRGDFTVCTPAELVGDHLNQQAIDSGPSVGYTKIRAKENFAVVAENSIKSTHIEGDGVNRSSHKRKRLVDVVESVDDMCLKSRKLHLQIEEKLSTLHSMLMKQTEEPLDAVGFLTNDDSQTEMYKGQRQGKVGPEDLCQDYERKNKNHSKTEVCHYTDLSGCSLDKLQKSVAKDREERFNSFGNDIIWSFDGDYMKLLDLDNPIEEQRFKVAIENPLSPTLPEIGIEGIESINIDKELRQRVPSEKENQSYSEKLDVDTGEIDPSKLSFSLSQCNDSIASFGSTFQSACGVIPKHFVVSSETKDAESYSKILYAIKSCMLQCSLMRDSGWEMKKILSEIQMEKKLLAKEKACVFFSLLLIKFSVTGSGILGFPLDGDAISLIDAFASHIRAEISDVETRKLLVDSCCFDELIKLIDDFLVEGKLIICCEMSSERLVACDRSINIDVEGVRFTLTSGAASTSTLVAGAVVLAAICAAVGQIGLICEASYRVGCTHGRNTSVMLAILHVFAHICGRDYFALSSYSLLMTALKSLVLFLEGTNSECATCPFISQAVPMDVALSLLLEELDNVALSDKMTNEVIGPVSNAQLEIPLFRGLLEENMGREDIEAISHGQSDIYCCLSNSEKIVAESSNPRGNLYSDVPSLIELIAVNLGWEWTKMKIVPELLKVLESCLEERSAASIIILVGQLGRLGVDVSGYNDVEIENLRCHLYAFLCQASNLQLGFPIQTAIVTALLSLLPIDFASILHGNGTSPANASQSVPARAISKWFSCLSEEQQASMYSLLQSTVVHKG